ncbi:hypothetical protein EYF80_036018 [Liparis tanakae]|uniref:Uncharacterized protein n=1 Tax=Liparis tanakae TaxID=230148 RepID=A0A4Z2GKN1_9TELE|nr:hypothetical protein EYF80_036018 [Liparis tanakae]
MEIQGFFEILGRFPRGGLDDRVNLRADPGLRGNHRGRAGTQRKPPGPTQNKEETIMANPGHRRNPPGPTQDTKKPTGAGPGHGVSQLA